MFEVNGVYANRNGKYTVLEINPPRMTVRYEDGTTADLKISVQERIWENIEVEFRASELSRMKSEAKAKKKLALGPESRYFIKIVSVSSGNELTFPGWSDRMIMQSLNESDPKLNQGDRILFYVLETKNFVGVATITGDAKKAEPSTYFYKVDTGKVDFFPVDIDAFVTQTDNGALIDTIELESQPNFRRMRLPPESLLEINEDDFEMVSELVTEVLEEIEEEIDDDDDDYSEEDEL